MLRKALFAILISQLVACGWLFGEDSDKGGDTDSVPTNVISGELKKTSQTFVVHSDLYGRSSSCPTSNVGDTYVETDNFLVFGQEGVADHVKQYVGQAAENALNNLISKLGFTIEEFDDFRSLYTPNTYSYMYNYWTNLSEENPGFTLFELNEPFVQGFSEMEQSERDIVMYQYWINLDYHEKTDAINRSLRTPDSFSTFNDRIPVCVTTSGFAGQAFEYGIDVLSPSIALGTTTQSLDTYQHLLNHEFTHIAMNIITRVKRSKLPYWFLEGLPEYVSGHTAASSARTFGINVVRDRISKSDGNLTEYPAYHHAVKHLADNYGNGSASMGALLVQIRNDSLRNGDEGRDIQKDEIFNVKNEFHRALIMTFFDTSGHPISYADYIDIYEDLLE